jgi:transcriptional regulator
MTAGAMERMMRMILPFRLEIAQADGTWKLNQNKPAEIRARAAAALAAGDSPAREIAARMRALPGD